MADSVRKNNFFAIYFYKKEMLIQKDFINIDSTPENW